MATSDEANQVSSQQEGMTELSGEVGALQIASDRQNDTGLNSAQDPSRPASDSKQSRKRNKKSSRRSNNSESSLAESAAAEPEEGEGNFDYSYDPDGWEQEGALEVQRLVEEVWPQGVKEYGKQKEDWPSNGKHIVATYDDSSIVVYQAYCPAIAESAVRDQKFGGGGFSFGRMSWIKTNFLWMMYRCGWATKRNQERVLAIRISLQGFLQILLNALTGQLQKSQGLRDCKVRLQWDPDHSPIGGNLTRRAIQLGMKDEILRQYGTDWIVSITDITPFVRHQRRVLKERGQFLVQTPIEKVYTPPVASICQRIELDDYHQPRLVTH